MNCGSEFIREEAGTSNTYLSNWNTAFANEFALIKQEITI